MWAWRPEEEPELAEDFAACPGCGKWPVVVLGSQSALGRRGGGKLQTMGKTSSLNFHGQRRAERAGAILSPSPEHAPGERGRCRAWGGPPAPSEPPPSRPRGRAAGLRPLGRLSGHRQQGRAGLPRLGPGAPREPALLLAAPPGSRAAAFRGALLPPPGRRSAALDAPGAARPAPRAWGEGGRPRSSWPSCVCALIHLVRAGSGGPPVSAPAVPRLVPHTAGPGG